MPRQRFVLLVAPLLFSWAAEAKPEAPPRPTVVVAPFASSSAEEHAWIGEALSEALSQRLLASGEAKVFSQRQWAAVLRARDIAARALFGKAFQKAARKKPPTRDVYAWYHLSRCRDALSLQSLGPRAEPRLPKPLVEEALRHLERAQERDRRLAEAQSFEALARLLRGDAKKARALAEQARKGAELGWPDVVAAFISQEVGALEKLRAAVQAGFAERARFEGDPDLAKVVKDPAFAAIFEGPSEPSPEKAPGTDETGGAAGSYKEGR